jgi:hypothetical protein
MLKALRAGLGFRVATAIAVFAALCLIAPPAVMAFGHGKTTAHCLTNADVVGHGMHKAATPKHQSDHGKLPGTGAPGCCGLYCLSALPLASSPVVEGLSPSPALSPPLETILTGGLAARLDRPPISSLSV